MQILPRHVVYGRLSVAILWTTAVIGMAARDPAPQAPATPPAFRSGIEIVQVDVSVLDKKREPVTGLTIADFTLRVDGRVRPVVAFTAVDLTTSAGAHAVETTDAARSVTDGNGRLIVIVMDRSIASGPPTQMARRIATAAINQMGPNDLAAVVYTGSAKSQDFTRDRARLFATIGVNQATSGLSTEATAQWQATQNQLEESIQRPDQDPRTPRVLPDADYSGECMCGLCVTETITDIANALKDIPRRSKSLLFIGADIAVESTQAQCADRVKDSREAMFRAVDNGNLTVHAFDASGLDTRLIGANVNVDGRELAGPMNPQARRPAGVSAVVRRQMIRQGHLSVLPARTGGRTILNTNTPEMSVPDVFKENASYYLLGFEPASAGDGKRHEINVKVARDGVIVRTRRGYVAAPPRP